jgi:predicted dinucleotide-binding enzyme
MSKIGIIGAGHIGGTLARRLVALGHSVGVANSRGPDSLAAFAAESGAKPVSLEQAVAGKDLIVVSIPMKAIPALPVGLFANVPATVPVIDTGNYYPRERDGRIAAIEDGKTEAQWVADSIGRPVVKVFNNIYFKNLADGGRPKGAADRVALPVSGDDPAHKAAVIALLDELGFDAVDNGGLDESWRQQPDAPAYGGNKDVAGVKEQLAAASPVRTEKFKAHS